MSLSYTLEHLDDALDRSFRVAPEIDPKRTLLQVLDMQPVCADPDGAMSIPSVGGAPSGPDTVEPVKRVVERCREEGIPIVWSQWGLRPDGLDTGIPALKWPPLNPGTPESPASWGNPQTDNFADGLEPREGEPVVRKSRFSSFQGTQLDEYMQELGTEYLVIAGITSANCAHATAIDAWNKRYKVIVLADCTTAVPSPHTSDVPEGYGQHWEALRNIQMNYGDVITSAEFSGMLDASKEASDRSAASVG